MLSNRDAGQDRVNGVPPLPLRTEAPEPMTERPIVLVDSCMLHDGSINVCHTGQGEHTLSDAIQFAIFRCLKKKWIDGPSLVSLTVSADHAKST